MKKSSASVIFERKGNPAIQKFVDKNVDIAVQVLDYLKELGWTQKEFAKKLGKTEAEISKWLSGTHNLTLKSIAKMEVVLGKDIIITRRQLAKEAINQSIQLKFKATTNNVYFGNIRYLNNQKSDKFLRIVI